MNLAESPWCLWGPNDGFKEKEVCDDDENSLALGRVWD